MGSEKEKIPIRTSEKERPKNRWYRVAVRSAHVGIGDETHYNYVYAPDAVKALGRAKRMRGWKRDILPDINEMTTEEEGFLIAIIKELGEITVKEAKRGGYYGKRRQSDGSFVLVENLIRKRVGRNGQSNRV